MSKKSIPKETTLRKWKNWFSWLKIIDVGGKKKICKVCTSQGEMLKLTPSANLTFINDSTKFKMSSLSDHATADGHTCAIREQKNKKAIALGLTIAHSVHQGINLPSKTPPPLSCEALPPVFCELPP